MKLPLLALVLLPAALQAQAPQYRRAGGDTVRYREVTRATSDITSPQGAITLRSHHDARLAIAFARGDTARAWYEALTLRSEFPGGEQVPATAPLLGKPFVLTIDGRGGVETLAVPEFPREVSEATDLTHQFNDFFVKLPAGALRPGLEWTDTTRRAMPNAAGRTLRTTRVGRYRVRGDTVIGGVRGVVVEARMNNRIESDGPSPTPGMELRTAQEGTETGTFVFSPERGRLLARSRTGSLEGHIEFIGGPEPMKLPQKMKYESTIEILP
ncbi:MAG: hypothetical protein ICV87_13340 [Gemmatimonadetes bacterium]|nr:hypothetical protein [Gemmatimonadota bacterium]